MTDINGYGSLGYLSNIRNQNLSFEDIDKDGDGVISKEEYTSALQQTQTDSVEISSDSTTDDKTADENDAAIFEQEVKMEEALDNLKKQICIDFCGENSKYIADIAFDLKDYLEEFKTSYSGDIVGMAAAFEEALSDKYSELKSAYLSNTPQNIKSKVLDNIIEGLTGILDDEKIQTLGEILEEETDNFIAEYSGMNLEDDLRTHLEEYMKSDYDKLESSIKEYQIYSNLLGTYYANTASFEKLKEIAKNLMQKALTSGITLESGSVKITHSDQIGLFLANFANALELKSAIDTMLQAISKETLLEKISSGEISSGVEEAPAEEGNTAEDTTDVYQVNADQITSPFSGKKNLSRSEIKEMLLEDSVRNQFKLQIVEQMANNGVSFADFEAAFNNIYNTSVNDFVESLTTDTILPPKYIGTKAIPAVSQNKIDIREFTQLFNDNMAETIASMNQSATDFDIENVDISALNTNGDFYLASTSAERLNNDFSSKVINRIKPSVEAEAQRMCEANNVTFDEDVFNEIFEETTRTDFKGLKEFLTNFKTEYSIWVYSNRKQETTTEIGEETTSTVNSENDEAESVIYKVNADNITTPFKDDTRLTRSDIKQTLLEDSVRNQFKLQIVEQMANNGVSFADFEAAFNNIYNDSVNEYISSLDENIFKKSVISFSSVKYTTDSNNIDMDKFVEIFNNKMSETVASMNQSSTDFDIENIDITALNANGDFYLASSSAELLAKVINRVKPSVEAEAQRMCESNNVTFDDESFNEIFEETTRSDFEGLKEFLTNFKTEYSIWVYSQRSLTSNS